jgi:DNA end-binding protein Ku
MGAVRDPPALLRARTHSMDVATRRAIWTGSISFGLVNIPIRLYPATATHDIAFHQFHARTGQRIHHKRVAESGREVPYEQIVKGYEVSKGKVVLIEPEELAALEPRKSRTIEIEQFVQLSEIDPILWDKTYYVGSDASAGAQKSYELLRRSMEEAEKVGIGRFVMRTKEYLVTVRPFGRGLALETMFYADEIRDQSEAAGAPGRATSSPREVAMAKQLIDAMSAPFDLKKFKDTYRDRVEELVKRKARGEEIVVEEPPEQPEGVINLMDALKASLEQNGPAGRGSKRRASASRSSPPPRRGSSRASKASKASASAGTTARKTRAKTKDRTKQTEAA